MTNGTERISFETEGTDFSFLGILGGAVKKFGRLGISLIITGAAAIVFYIFGLKLPAVISAFLFLSFIFREPDIYTDTFMIESVSTFGMILAMISHAWIGAVFCFGTLWLTRLMSPHGPCEEIVDTAAMSLGFSLACFAVPFIVTRIPGSNLLYCILFFQATKFVLYYFFLSFLQPSVFFNDLMNAPVNIAMVLFQSYVWCTFLGIPVLGMFGDHGWRLASIFILKS